MDFVFGVVVGLIIGWNIFPQPQFVKNLIDTYILRKI
jgi:hypothetical protein